MNYDQTHAVLVALEAHRVEYAIFGAVALNLHGLARSTEDLDLFVAPRAENIDRLKRALRDVFDDVHIEEISSADLLGEYPAVQYVPPNGDFHLDILTRLGEAWTFDDLEIERTNFDGTPVSARSNTL